MLLNLVLLGLAAYAGIELRSHWRAARTRQTAELTRRTPNAPPPPFTPHATPPPALPSGYIDIAQKMLFDRSRNPDVPVEAPPPPPPPPPVPPMPVFHGAMNLGDGPFAIMSVSSNAEQQEVHPGDMIGPFKLVAINQDALTFEWNGQTISKSVDEISEHNAPPPDNSAQARPAAAAPPAPKQPMGPGQSTQFGYKLCAANDSMPEGTVQDGYRKVSRTTPFGTTCIWEPVGGGGK